MNNAVLHYGHAGEPNNERVAPNSLRLIDMGAEYHCYTADVTVTFPTSAKFTDEQKLIYNAVWEAVLAVERAVKPGVDYRDMHRLSHRVMLEQLVKTTSIFATSDVDQLVALNIMAYLSPHGLGHSIGTDVHCVGGYLPGERKDSSDLSLKGLRLGRPLKRNMVITVEPGIYFIQYLLDELRNDEIRGKLINWTEIERFRSVGGVRIEDNIVITANGCRVLSDVPRTVEDIEAVMTGRKDWHVGKQYRQYSH
jgi:Xaa-Pro dipeptidase